MAEIIGRRYRVDELLMQCRFTSLHRATDQVTGLPLVLRKFESAHGHVIGEQDRGGLHREARKQLLREGRTLKLLRHRNLPRLQGIVEQEKELYLLLEDMPGLTLEDFYQRNKPLSWEILRRYLSQLLSLAQYLHGQPVPIIHRDLRPETVLATTFGVLKIGEFGLAKMASEETEAGTAFRSKGDPVYSSPEQLLGQESHPRHDLYSIGAILYYLATGTEPPPALTRLGSGDSLLCLDRLRPDAPGDLVAVVDRLLSPDANKRPPSAQEALSSLEQVSGELRLPQFLLDSPESEPTSLKTASVQESDTEPDGPARASRKSSMWSLLFGRKNKTGEKGGHQVNGLRHEQPLSEEKDVPFIALEKLALDRRAAQVLSEALSRTIHGICIGRVSEREITVACKDPSDVHIYDNIAMAASPDIRVNLVKADPRLIDNALEFVFRSQHLAGDTTWGAFLEQKQLDQEQLVMTSQSASVSFDDEALEGPIVDLVDRLIKEAISAGASDIHLEPYESGMEVRYRIDGVLRRVNRVGSQDMSAVVKRIKVLGNLDIAQERLTQGGRISLRIGSEEFDLRVSVIPVPVGESVVMRVLKKGAFTMTLSDLGFDPRRESQFRGMLSQPYGMILVCGPTGSGKSTSLYASLKEIARPDRKLLTVEDPIEYQMPGIMQVQVNTAPRETEKKLTFSRALREFLRQDPDVILVGEIRDQETAEISVQAALTGHLLLSTIHTNDSLGIISRLRDMGCEPFLISSVLLGGVAQRLARRLCQNCKEPAKIPPQYLELFSEAGIEQPQASRGRGCRECNHTGSKGRVGIYELLEITPELRAQMAAQEEEETLRATAVTQGFKPLLSDGLEKVHGGIVSLEEVLRVCRTVGQSSSVGEAG